MRLTFYSTLLSERFYPLSGVIRSVRSRVYTQQPFIPNLDSALREITVKSDIDK